MTYPNRVHGKDIVMGNAWVTIEKVCACFYFGLLVKTPRVDRLACVRYKKCEIHFHRGRYEEAGSVGGAGRDGGGAGVV